LVGPLQCPIDLRDKINRTKRFESPRLQRPFYSVTGSISRYSQGLPWASQGESQESLAALGEKTPSIHFLYYPKADNSYSYHDRHYAIARQRTMIAHSNEQRNCNYGSDLKPDI
jgi:hypothetical protein